MKFISFVALFSFPLIFIEPCAGQDLIIGQPIPTPAANVFDCTNRTHAFCNTCNSIVFCMDAENQLTTVCTGTNRYCYDNSGTEDAICVADENANVNCLPSTKFVCTDVGFFPNPTDCTKFYYCPAVNGQAQPYSCGAPGWVYTGSSITCKKQVHTKDCAILDCLKSPGGTIGYAPDPTVFAVCGGIQPDGSQDMFVFRCKYGEVYDSAKKNCAFKCSAEGYFANGRDPNSYYLCYRVGISIEYIKIACPQGMKFDDARKECVS